MVVKGVMLAITITIAVLALLGQIKRYKEAGTALNKLLLLILAYMIYHLVYIWICDVYFPWRGWATDSAPFGLMYGTFIYFLVRTKLSDRFPPKELLLHSTPYIIFSIIHLGLMLGGVGPDDTSGIIYMNLLYILIPLAFLAYTLWGIRIVFYKRVDIKPIYYPFFLGNTLLLFMLGMFYSLAAITAVLQGDESSIGFYSRGTTGMMIVLAMLVCVSSILVFVILNPEQELAIIKKDGAREQSDKIAGKDSGKSPSGSYKNSSLSEADLCAYEAQLDEFMECEQPWRDSSLKLKSLANAMKIPKHHLTQVISTQKKKNFNEYINGMRVNYARKLLNEENDLPMEEIGYRSGFNSKTTFYRWFKKIMHTTPTKYQKV